MTFNHIYSRLKKVAPSVVFATTREVDSSFRWDGYGPDPARRGFEPCDVTASAQAVVSGETRIAENYLGGSYFRPHEPTGDVQGYLPQMLEEAAVLLCQRVPRSTPLEAELLEAISFLRAEQVARSRQTKIKI